MQIKTKNEIFLIYIVKFSKAFLCVGGLIYMIFYNYNAFEQLMNASRLVQAKPNTETGGFLILFEIITEDLYNFLTNVVPSRN